MNSISDQEALRYHSEGRPGKIGIEPTKPGRTQHDLSLAYSPGVAAPARAIAADPADVYRYTNKGNLVAVLSNGSAVLGLGNIGPLAAKPVMGAKDKYAPVKYVGLSIGNILPGGQIGVESLFFHSRFLNKYDNFRSGPGMQKSTDSCHNTAAPRCA